MFFQSKLAVAIIFVGGLDATAFRTPRYAMDRRIGSCPMSPSSESSCGEVCITGYQGLSCNIAVAYAKIEDSMGFSMPLNWTMYTTDAFPINSISYSGPTTKNTVSCKATQFSFYEQDLQAGIIGRVSTVYLTPGQSGRGCVTFGNASVTEYDGVSMYVDAPEATAAAGAGR